MAELLRFTHDSDHSLSSSSSSDSSESTLRSLSFPSRTPEFTKNNRWNDEMGLIESITTLNGHSAGISSLAVAGDYLYSGGADGETRIWDLGVSPNTRVVAGGYGGVKSIAISGDRLFTAHHDCKIRVWRIDGGGGDGERKKLYKLIATLPTVKDRCMKVFSPGSYVQIRRHKKRTWVHHVDAVSAIAITKDGSFIYSVSWDRSMKLWRTSDFKCVESVEKAHHDAINAVVLSDNVEAEFVVVTGSADRTIKVWKRIKKVILVCTLEGHTSAVNALSFSSDGAVLYSGAADRSIIVWSKHTVHSTAGENDRRPAETLLGHKKSILCLAVMGELLFSGSGDGTVRIWRKGSENSHSCLAELDGHASPVKCLTAAGTVKCKNDSEKCYIIYTGGVDLQIKLWRILVPNYP